MTVDTDEIRRDAEAAYMQSDDAGRLRMVLNALDQIEAEEVLYLGTKREGVDLHAILAGPCVTCPGFLANVINHLATRAEELAADLEIATTAHTNRRVPALESCACAISSTAEAARRAKRLATYN